MKKTSSANPDATTSVRGWLAMPLGPVAIALCLIAAVAMASAHAQQRSSASVSVDYSVLDGFGQSDRIVLVKPGTERVVLHPPKGVKRYAPVKLRTINLTPPGGPCTARVDLTDPAVEQQIAARRQSREIEVAAAESPAPEPAPAAKPARKQQIPAKAAPQPAPKIAKATRTSATPAPAKKTAVAAKPATKALTPPSQKSAERKVPAVPSTPAPANQDTDAPLDITAPPAQVASLPQQQKKPAPAAFKAGDRVATSFREGGVTVSKTYLSTMKRVTDQLPAMPKLRIQLLSYATDPEKNVSRARRLSLQRAVAVRQVLINNGFDSTRIEAVRPLGEQNPGGDPNHVDIILVARR